MGQTSSRPQGSLSSPGTVATISSPRCGPHAGKASCECSAMIRFERAPPAYAGCWCHHAARFQVSAANSGLVLVPVR